MKRSLASRIELLETQMMPEQIHSSVFLFHPLPDERFATLEPGERLVFDYYRQDGLLISASERITSDPNDRGKRCKPGEYLEEVIRDLHQDCEWRKRGGSCRTCENTPVANT